MKQDKSVTPVPSGVSRRTVVKGAAWAVPAIAVASSVPVMAASGGPPTGLAGDGCKLPGASCAGVFVKGYLFEVTLSNDTGKAVYLYNQAGYQITITENSPDITLYFQAAVNSVTGEVISFPYMLADGASITIILNAGENGNSANVQDLVGAIYFPWGHTPTPPDPDGHPDVMVPFDYADTPPIQNPGCDITLPPNCGMTTTA